MKVNKITKNISESTANSNGIYSLNTGWVKQPVKDDIPDTPEDEEKIEEILKPFIERFNKIMNY